MSNCFKRPESLLIAFKIAAVHQYKNGKKLVQSEASTNIFLSLSDMHLILIRGPEVSHFRAMNLSVYA